MLSQSQKEEAGQGCREGTEAGPAGGWCREDWGRQ